MSSKREKPDPDSGGEGRTAEEEEEQGSEEGSLEDHSTSDHDHEEGDRKPAATEAGGDNNIKPKRKRRRVISALQESKWQQMYQRLYTYKQKHGNCLVPNRFPEDASLGAWVATQRRNYRLYTSGQTESSGMTAERIQLLEDLGFQWTTTDPRHEPWQVRYEALKGFVNKYGHAEIPMRWDENVQLSNWVSKQRQDYKLRVKGKSSRLTDERMQLLNDIDFQWHIPRKGRKIKLQSIPVIKKKPKQVSDEPSSSGDGATGSNAARLPPLRGVAPASPPPMASVPRMPGAARPDPTGTDTLPQPYPPTPTPLVPGVATLQNTGIPGMPSSQLPAAALNPAHVLGLQGVDLSSLLNLYNNPQGASVPGAGYPMQNNNGAAALSIQALMAATANPSAGSAAAAASGGQQQNAATAQQILQSQLEQQQQQQGLVLPVQLGQLLSALQQQQQVVHIPVPVPMPWYTNALAGQQQQQQQQQNPFLTNNSFYMPHQGMAAINIPPNSNNNPVSAVTPSTSSSSSMSTATALLVSQLLTNAAAVAQQQAAAGGNTMLSAQAQQQAAAAAQMPFASLLGIPGVAEHLQQQQQLAVASQQQQPQQQQQQQDPPSTAWLQQQQHPPPPS